MAARVLHLFRAAQKRAPMEELQTAMLGKRGMLCKVLRGGMIQPGESIEVEAVANVAS